MSVSGVILVRIFSHSYWIRTKMTPNTDTFHAVFNPKCICSSQLVNVNPATSYIQERSFSTTRHLKTRLKSTMTKRRFNSLSLLNVHKELTAKLDLAEVGNEFISLNKKRFQYFGKLVQSDFTSSSRLVCFNYSQHCNMDRA